MTKEKPWLKTIDPRVPRDIRLPEQSVYKFLEDAATACPTNRAIYFYGTELTYGELMAAVRNLAGSLRSLGIEKGDRVAICMDNCPQYVISFFAILALGAAVVQVSPMVTEREFQFLVSDAGAKAVLTLDYLYAKTRSSLEDGTLSFAAVGSLYDYLPAEPVPVRPFAIPDGRLDISFEDKRVYDFRHLLGMDLPFSPPIINPRQDLAVLQYTSGTTGIPKGVMITHYNLTSYITMVNNMDYRAVYGQEVYPVTLPMSHNYGMFQTVVLPVSLASLIVIMVRFHPDEALRMIELMKPTVFRAVPTMLTMLSQHPRISQVDLSSVRHWIVGGAPVPAETVEFFQRVSGANIVEGYGLSESTSGVVINSLYGRTSPGMGMPLIGMDARVVSPASGEDAAVGQEGELLLKGPTITAGYWNKPEETARVIKDGWLYTGDIVRMDEGGVLTFIDRLKEIIIVSGFNVYPTEVENVLFEHPAVLEAAVIGVPDPKQGEAVKAIVILKPDQKADEDDIVRFCQERLSPYKVPKSVDFVSQFPRNATGKVLKKELKARYLAPA